MEVSAIKYLGASGAHGRSPLLRLQSDERLVALVRRGNQHAFEVLVARYQSRLLAFCRHMLSSREDAEDVLQEVFTAAFNAMTTDERPLNVRPWLYRIARNRCLNHLRRVPAVGVDSMDVHLSEGGISTADKAHRREDFRMLVGDVQELPESQRTALLMREIDALSYEQIAEAMDNTVPSVKSLLVRARIGLAEAAEARELDCDDVRFELAEISEGLKRMSSPIRRHLRSCESCSKFKKQLSQTNRSLAALLPVGPLFLAKKMLLAHLGTSAAASGGAGGTGATAAGGALTGGAAATGSALTGGAAATGSALTGGAVATGSAITGGAAATGLVSAGLGAVSSKAAAGLAAAAIVTAGAVEAKHVSPDRARPAVSSTQPAGTSAGATPAVAATGSKDVATPLEAGARPSPPASERADPLGPAAASVERTADADVAEAAPAPHRHPSDDSVIPPLVPVAGSPEQPKTPAPAAPGPTGRPLDSAVPVTVFLPPSPTIGLPPAGAPGGSAPLAVTKIEARVIARPDAGLGSSHPAVTPLPAAAQPVVEAAPVDVPADPAAPASPTTAPEPQTATDAPAQPDAGAIDPPVTAAVDGDVSVESPVEPTPSALPGSAVADPADVASSPSPEPVATEGEMPAPPASTGGDAGTDATGPVS